MAVSLVIAHRDMGDPHRRPAVEYVRAWYAPLKYELVEEAGADDSSFGRASAINAGVRRAAGDIVVQADPDSLVPLAVLRRAVRLARQADGLVIPHDRYLYLTEAAASQVYAGRGPFSCGPDDCEESGPNGSGNVVVFSRHTWDAVGGFDERFGLWGGDDAAFRYAADAWFGPTRRLPGDMVHLWHPRLPQSKPGHPDYHAQFEILGQYRDAAEHSPEAVQQIVRTR